MRKRIDSRHGPQHKPRHKSGDKEDSEIQKTRNFACPYWKFDPVKHLQCLHSVQTAVRHVKRHLIRSHLQPIHCPTCHRTFHNDQDRQQHIVERVCARSSDPFPYRDGISYDQKSQLDRLSRGSCEEDTWYCIWEVLFPGELRPPSPYADVEKFQQDIEEHFAKKYLQPGYTQEGNTENNLYTSNFVGRSTFQVFNENSRLGLQTLPRLNSSQPHFHVYGDSGFQSSTEGSNSLESVNTYPLTHPSHQPRMRTSIIPNSVQLASHAFRHSAAMHSKGRSFPTSVFQNQNNMLFGPSMPGSRNTLYPQDMDIEDSQLPTQLRTNLVSQNVYMPLAIDRPMEPQLSLSESVLNGANSSSYHQEPDRPSEAFLGHSISAPFLFNGKINAQALPESKSATYRHSAIGNLSSTHPTASYQNTDIRLAGPEQDDSNCCDDQNDHTLPGRGRHNENGRPSSSHPGFLGTDSGYASALNANHFAEHRPDRANDHETQTVYSAATVIPKAQAQQYILGLYDSIQSRLQHRIDKDVWPSLSHSLPRILKAFAVRIGLESSSQINRSIMYFVHRRVRSILHHFESAILDQGDQTENASEDNDRNRKDDMSLKDKMSLWGSKSKDLRTSLRESELFQGVDDAFEDEDLEVSQLINYNKALQKSTSFDWLLKGLERELLLKFNTEYSTSPDQNSSISQTILENLPTGVISKSKPPVSHTLKLEFIGWPILNQINGRIASQRPSKTAFESLTVICCGNDAQAMTIHEYMEQVWPKTWREIYHLLLAVLDDSSSKTYMAVLTDGTQLSACIENGGLAILIRGSSYTIAECGDQLAWLRVALGAAHSAWLPLTQQTPRIVYATKPQNTFEDGLSRAEMMNWQKQTLPSFCLGIDIKNITNPARQQQLWSQLLPGSYTIVSGYPILRRPPGYSGLEISPEQLIKSSFRSHDIPSKTTSPTSQDSRVSLSFVNETENVLLWHMSEDLENPCDCYKRLQLDSDGPKRVFDESILQSCRHIVGGCDGTGSAIDVLKTRQIQGIHRSSAPLDDEIKRHGGDSPAFTNPLPVKAADEIQPYPMERYSAGFQSPDSGRSSDSSLDSCMLSISDTSENIDPLPPLIHRTLETTALRLYADYRSSVCNGEYTEQGAHSHSGNTLSAPSLGNGESSSRGSHGLGKKRKHSSENEDEDDSNRNSRPNAPAERGNKMLSKLFACPFLKFDPEKHRRCFRMKLRRIRDVKQHIHRKHAPEFYCDRCSAIFPKEDTLQQHINHIGGLNCTPSSTLDGVTYRQRSQLSRKSAKNSSEEEQWFAIWNIVFPGQQKPPTAYMDASLSEDICLFENYCRNHSQTVLNIALEAARPSGDVQMTNEELQRCLRSVLDRGLAQLFDDFHSMRSSESSNLPASLHNGNLNRAGITDSTPDSGFETASQYRTPHNRSSTGTQDVSNNQPVFDLSSPSGTRTAPNPASLSMGWDVDTFPALFGDEILNSEIMELANAEHFGQFTSDFAFNTNDPNLDSTG